MLVKVRGVEGMRWAALATALLAIGGQLAAAMHLHTTEHAICPDHGELVDVAGHAHRSSHAHALADACGHEDAAAHHPQVEAEDAVLRARSVPEHAHDHHHCGFLAFMRGAGQALTAAHPSGTLEAAAAVAAFVEGAPQVGGIPLLLLAPKSSPPPLG
jgi:hypothetical protein